MPTASAHAPKRKPVTVPVQTRGASGCSDRSPAACMFSSAWERQVLGPPDSLPFDSPHRMAFDAMTDLFVDWLQARL
jgi:hypothetical protein